MHRNTFWFHFLSDLVNNHFCYLDFFSCEPQFPESGEWKADLWVVVTCQLCKVCQHMGKTFCARWKTGKQFCRASLNRDILMGCSVFSPASGPEIISECRGSWALCLPAALFITLWLPQYYLSDKVVIKLIIKWSILNLALPVSNYGYYMHVLLPRLHSWYLLTVNLMFLFKRNKLEFACQVF